MIVVDAIWSDPVNEIVLVCDCGTRFSWPSNFSLAECPSCRRAEWWFPMWPEPPFSSYRTATIALEVDRGGVRA